MKPLLLAVSLFVAGYITAQYSLLQHLTTIVKFAWNNGVVWRAFLGLLGLSLGFALFLLPLAGIAEREVRLNSTSPKEGIEISAREQLRRRGSFY
ncbi:phosphatidylinositol glycan, class Q [Peziza echinospora]|nr:phosphatidylinositol glycan, class Q [Peziza echinospora]